MKNTIQLHVFNLHFTMAITRNELFLHRGGENLCSYLLLVLVPHKSLNLKWLLHMATRLEMPRYNHEIVVAQC